MRKGKLKIILKLNNIKSKNQKSITSISKLPTSFFLGLCAQNIRDHHFNIKQSRHEFYLRLLQVKTCKQVGRVLWFLGVDDLPFLVELSFYTFLSVLMLYLGIENGPGSVIVASYCLLRCLFVLLF